ncbi:MAG TPA: glycosyltransferase family 2 protein [Anaerolineae bacterium]|nr:glycosyltransferase family 2 protein [Anaerolineae bacterium]
MQEQPLISVVIPNWNGAEHLPTCLNSLRRQTYPRVEVIVADNDSHDGSLALLERQYPEVKVVGLDENRGYAGGVNAGIAAAEGEILAILNNDTEANPRWLEELCAGLERHPEAGSATSKILLFDRRKILNSTGDLFTTEGVPVNRGVWEEDEGQFDEEDKVFSPCGGACAVRRSVLEDLASRGQGEPFDEDFFAYCEDVDLGWRSQLAGYQCLYVPTAKIYHKLSATGGGKIASYYTGRNFIYVLGKDYPASLFRKHWLRVLRAQLRITWEALRAWRGDAARARIRGQLSGLWNLPRILRKRRAIQGSRVVSDAYLESLLIN